MMQSSTKRPSRDGLFLWSWSHSPICGYDADPRNSGWHSGNALIHFENDESDLSDSAQAILEERVAIGRCINQNRIEVVTRGLPGVAKVGVQEVRVGARRSRPAATSVLPS